MVSITKAEVPGLTLEKYHEFNAELPKHQSKLDKKQTITMLADTDGHMTYHIGIKMPMMLTNRSFFNVCHQYTNDDGAYIDLRSYMGSEEAIASAEGKKLAGKNVLGTNYIDYRILEPIDGGIKWTSVLCTNVGGSIPVYLQNQGASEMAANFDNVLCFIMTGKYP